MAMFGGKTAITRLEKLYRTSRIFCIEMKSGCILFMYLSTLCINSPNDHCSNALAHHVNFYYNFYLVSFLLWVVTRRALGLC